MTAQARADDVVNKTTEYSFVNLTKLSWQQPLVASVRLLLASKKIPSWVLVQPDGSAYSDNEIRHFLSAYDTEKLQNSDKSNVIDVNRSALARRTSDDNIDLITNVFRLQREFADELYRILGDRSRAGAIMSVLFAELGWQVRIVADILDVSRPTVNKWVMIHVNEPLTDSEIDTIAIVVDKKLSSTDGNDEVLGAALLDVRNFEFRTKRSGLSWRKVVALPTPEIATIMRALWRVSYRARGAKSTREERVCSFLLDLMLDLLMRRGMTAQNIAAVMGMTHRAVFARLERSEILNDPSVSRMTAAEIAPMIRGVLKSGDDDSKLFIDADDLRKKTVTTLRNISELDDYRNILLQVKTHAASAINPTPIVSVYALTAPDNLSSNGERRLFELDRTSPSALSSTLKDIALGTFRCAEISVNSNIRNEKLERLLDAVSDDTFADLDEVPLADDDIAAAVFGADRYWYPSVLPQDEWTDGEVFAEALLVQAVGQYDRDAEDFANGTNRPGFGTTTYHWIPAEVLDKLVHISFRDRGVTEMSQAKTDVDIVDSDSLVRDFLPQDVYETVKTWTEETAAETDYERPQEFEGKSLLWMCLNRPRIVTNLFPAPKSLDNDTDDETND